MKYPSKQFENEYPEYAEYIAEHAMLDHQDDPIQLKHFALEAILQMHEKKDWCKLIHVYVDLRERLMDCPPDIRKDLHV